MSEPLFDAGAATKRCPDCGLYKPLADFPRNRGTRDGRATYCKPCHNARGRDQRERLYGGSRHYHLKRRYGIGADEVDALILGQHGICPICRRRPPEHVDHDHETGAVRGVLCFACNGGLGLFSDDVDVLARAIAYLDDPPARRHEPGVGQLVRERLAALRDAG